jgi:hypothetical protein
MSRTFIWVLVFSWACGGTLTDEQRKKAKKDMEDHAIKKITEAEIIETSFSVGRKITALLAASHAGEKHAVDSLQTEYNVKLVYLNSSSTFSNEIEKQVIGAYTMSSGETELTDNVQKVGFDSLLYTKPVLRELPDGSKQFVKALAVKMSRKSVVLSIKK